LELTSTDGIVSLNFKQGEKKIEANELAIEFNDDKLQQSM
jgi:hypothetical protein